ncbi:hypothetical protein AYK26_04060 [Euryarchaeota archaeon SM23-78]|nr:MAG: hypothetical protein AYK26_04060 [Euryarchaeota archaeon SM23-78]MBW3000957.1 hypothetical protein [Candidatus Woesearchaeota archaeon]
MKIRLGYSNEYIYIGDAKPEQLVEERAIKCSFCNKKLKKDDWISILHTLGDKHKPKRLHFFCKSKNCHYEWGLQGQKQRER